MVKNKKGINQEIKNNKKTFNIIEVVIIMFITCFFGIFIGSLITFITVKTTSNNSLEQEDKYVDRFKQSYNNILSNYYNKVDKDKLIDSAIKGMIDYLDDPYANYMNEDESLSFSEEVEGEYVGIGCEITIDENNQVIVSKIFKSSPALESGLKVNDIIIGIDGKDITNSKDLSELTSIKGKANSKVKLTVKRDGKNKEIVITRKKIEIPSVSSDIKKTNNKNIGIIKINVFASNTDKQFKNELKKLEKQNINALVIDVRDNNGGYLSSVTNIASMFLEKNKIIYQLSSKGIKEPILDNTKEKRNYKVAVLINETSASASEVLAAAIKESYKGTVVGVKSYGKGTVQKAYYLSNGTSYKYTIQQWLTPKGKSIDNKGITPDIIEENSNEQLQKAIEVLVN